MRQEFGCIGPRADNLPAGGLLAPAPSWERSMYCSRSMTVHLLRGFGAAGLIALAVIYREAHAWLLPPALIGAIVLMRGCPMCWLMGLVETAQTRRNSPVGREIR
jgi:hypothetical protein